ncbi:hypothetical protein [Methylobacterium sp. J-090]|uniref:hypothetical protein n=1 Tax=Methylobacterium sp. J-090 TaxID=2836666 RepID=UPI001FB9CEC6|nr:hypothetical protein [Methylobacterium sp. J-090]MCJ2084197.1 hypothetical protein [Methylobacterium sp. J-090]
MKELDTSAIGRSEMDNRLAYLHVKLSEPGGLDLVVDAGLELVLVGMGIPTATTVYPPESIPAYTASLDEARKFVALALPGFYVTSGLCALTGHASLGPDYNGPDGERLRTEWPPEETPCCCDEDLAPGDGVHRECRAILAAAVRALAHRRKATP